MAIYTFDFERKIMNEIDQMGRSNKIQPIFFGGIAGPNGGATTGPLKIIGQLPQSKVALDTTEATTSGTAPSGSLLHNLNRIRGGWAMGDGFLKARHLSSEITFTALPDTPDSYSSQKLKVVRVKYDESGLEFATISGGTGTGATQFTQLTDVPNSYVGEKYKVPRVKSDESGLEFVSVSGGGVGAHNLLSTTHSDTIADTGILGDLISWSGGSWRKFAGNINNTIKYLAQIGTGAVSASPFWTEIAPGSDSNAIHSNVSNEISGITEKTTLVNDDIFIIEDSEASNVKKKVKKSNVGGGTSVSSDNYTITVGSTVIGPVFPLTPVSLGSFTAVNQGSSTATTEGNAVVLYDPTVDSSINYRIWKKSYTAPKAVKVLFLPNLLRINYQHYGIGFFDNSNAGHVLRIIPGDTELRSTTINSPTADSSNYGLDVGGVPVSLFGPYLWLGIEDNNTNRIISFSVDGQHFVKLHTISRTNFITPTGWGFFINSRSNKDCRVTILSWEESTSLNYT